LTERGSHGRVGGETREETNPERRNPSPKDFGETKQRTTKEQGVAETTPKPPLGVVSATPLAPWGWLATSGFFFLILFLKNIYIFV
jgi:hypothetical protein